uniref:Uncharacterized protein n=1 Tax=Tanacetum cinerariifolium TaxID=118510 RepID=A0A6L2KL07_TANCI|nr:hypothetical protein [Tanacetum cinerariifolium]
MFPDMVLSIDDFHNHVEVAIQTHGYDTWQGGESNLLVTMAMFGRLSNTSYMVFQYRLDNVVDHLTTTGITAIPDERRSVEELEGMMQIINKQEEHAFPTATDAKSSTSYQPPPDAIIGPALFPPTRQNPQLTYKPDYQFGYPQGRGNAFNGGYEEYHNLQLTLPPTWTESGVMLVLPANPGLWLNLAIKSGKLYFPSTTKKLFAKLLPSLSKKIEESFKAEHPGLSEGNFAKDYRSKQGNIARLAIYQELDLDDKWDIVSPDFDDSSVYSISEGEGDVYQNISVMVQDTPFEKAVFMTIKGFNESDDERSIKENYDDQDSHHAFMFHPGPPTKIADMVQSAGLWKPDTKLPTQSKSSCALRTRNYLGKIVNVKGKQPHKPEEEKDFSSNEEKLIIELLKEKTEQDQ